MCILNVCWIPVLDTFWMSARSTELDLEGWGPWKCDRGSLYKVQTGLENVGKMNCKFRVFSKARCMNPPTVWGLRWGNFGLTLDWVGFWFCTTLNFVEAQYHVGTTRFGLAPNTMLEFTGGSRNHCTRVRVHARTLKSVKAAKPPWNAQAAKPPWNAQAAKLPWNAQAAKPQSRRAASSATHAPPPVFIAAALPPPWIAEAAKPQSRKLWAVSCVHRRCVARASRSVKEPQSAKASKHHEASKRQSFKKRQSVKKRQSFKKRHSAEASKSRQRKAGCA